MSSFVRVGKLSRAAERYCARLLRRSVCEASLSEKEQWAADPVDHALFPCTENSTDQSWLRRSSTRSARVG